jgi:hypothetical protein
MILSETLVINTNHKNIIINILNGSKFLEAIFHKIPQSKGTDENSTYHSPRT